jgi:hypothetical protein
LITGHPQRRRIASILIVLGRAGLVTMVATIANSLRPSEIMSKFSIPLLHLVIPSNLLPWINLIIIIVAILIVFMIFTRTKIVLKLTDILRTHIVKKAVIKPVTFEELVVTTGGYGVSEIEICDASSVLNKTLHEADLRKSDVLVLAIERKGGIIPNPPPEMKILLGDRLICFGRLENIRKELCNL